MDEEALAATRAGDERLRHGAFYTPAPLVARVLDAVSPFVPRGALRVVDPACGAGAFLVQAAARWPRASLVGVELEPATAAQCRARVPRARVLEGNALTAPVLDEALPEDRAFELWLGNPPWNGTSPLLRDPAAWRRVTSWVPPHLELKRGTSLRDDFLFFLLLASRRLEGRRGALAFITPATFIDAYAFAPVRGALLSRLELRDVIELPAGTFAGTKVVPCVTVWTSRARDEVTTRAPTPGTARGGHPRPALGLDAGTTDERRRSPVRQATSDRRPGNDPTSPREAGPTRRRRDPRQDELVAAAANSAATSFVPHGPVWRLRPLPARAEALDAAWRASGATLPELVPVSFAGLKTRFDELLVDDDRERLVERVRAFLSARSLPAFARRFDLEPFLPKLEALREFSAGARFDPANVRRFLRYRGPNPMRPPGWCYVDRRLIPRGDHRLRGDFDPHASRVKLVFNAHELPLAAHVLDEPGCVTMYRHTRFAPLEVPRSLLENPGDPAPSGRLVPNLSPAGLALAERLGSPRAVFEHIAAHVNSDDFQRHWAPAFGAAEAPLIATGSRSAGARPTRARARRRGA